MLNEEFISQKNDEEFIIHRKLKGKDIIFGTYSTLNDALKARDKLDDDGWPIPVQNQNINTYKFVNDNNEPEKYSTSKLTNNSSLVIFDKLHEKWRIQLKNGDKKYFVGSYDSENEAKKAENDYFNIKNNSNKIQIDENEPFGELELLTDGTLKNNSGNLKFKIQEIIKIYELYNNENESIRTISQEYNCSESLITKIINRYDENDFDNSIVEWKKQQAVRYDEKNNPYDLRKIFRSRLSYETENDKYFAYIIKNGNEKKFLGEYDTLIEAFNACQNFKYDGINRLNDIIFSKSTLNQLISYEKSLEKPHYNNTNKKYSVNINQRVLKYYDNKGHAIIARIDYMSRLSTDCKNVNSEYIKSLNSFSSESKNRGVFYSNNFNKWVAQVLFFTNIIHVGFFDTEKEAIVAREKYIKNINHKTDNQPYENLELMPDGSIKPEVVGNLKLKIYEIIDIYNLFAFKGWNRYDIMNKYHISESLMFRTFNRFEAGDFDELVNQWNQIQSDNNSDNKSIVSEKNLNENNNAKEIISYNSEIEKYLAYFEFEKREIYLGQYNTADEAQNGINIYKKIINSKIKLNGKIKYNQRTGKFYSYNLNRNEYIGNYINILEAKKAIDHYISKSDEKINEEIDTTQVLNDKYISFNNGFYIISKYIKSENVLFDAFLLKEDAEKKINHLIRRKWKIDKNKKLGNNILYNGQKYILYNIVHNEIKVYGLYSDLEEAMDYKEFLINNNWKQTIKRNKEYNKSKLNKTTKNQINKLKKENKSLKKEIQSINSNKIDERKIQNTLEKVKSSYIKIVNDKNIKLQNSNKEIHILKKENESLKKANKKLSNESYFTSKKMEQLNEEINLINNELKNLELNYSKIINNLKNENKILNNEKIKLQVDNQKLIKKYNKDNLKDTTKLKTKTPEEIKENKFLKYKSSALQLYKNPKNIECLKCGFKNPVSVKYCISCGSNLANQKQ